MEKETNNTETNKVGEVAKVKQAASKTYTLKSLKANIEKLKNMNLITEKEEDDLNKIRQNAIAKYMKEEF